MFFHKCFAAFMKPWCILNEVVQSKDYALKYTIVLVKVYDPRMLVASVYR